jgi:hypothetical protein
MKVGQRRWDEEPTELFMASRIPNGRPAVKAGTSSVFYCSPTKEEAVSGPNGQQNPGVKAGEPFQRSTTDLQIKTNQPKETNSSIDPDQLQRMSIADRDGQDADQLEQRQGSTRGTWFNFGQKKSRQPTVRQIPASTRAMMMATAGMSVEQDHHSQAQFANHSASSAALAGLNLAPTAQSGGKSVFYTIY